MDMELKERSPYMFHWMNDEPDELKEYYCEKCQTPIWFRECEGCGNMLDRS